MMGKNFIRPVPKISKAKCFVYGCKFEKYNRHDPERKYISTFHTPKKREVFEKWVQCCGRMDLFDVPIETLKRTLHICELHFTTLHGGIVRKRISHETVPTCFHKGHTALSEEAMTSWRSMDHYKQYWSAYDQRAAQVSQVSPANNLQRCPNLGKSSTACQSAGPFPCLYCDTVHQPVQALDPDLLDLVPNLPAPSVAPIAPSSSCTTNKGTMPPLREAVGNSLFNVVKNYFEQNEPDNTKSSQKVIVIKCADPEKTEGESSQEIVLENEDKKLIVVKIESPSSKKKQESTLPQNHSNLLEKSLDHTESSLNEVCELPPPKVVKKHTPIPSKKDRTMKVNRSKPEKPVYRNFKFTQKIIPIPSSYRKFCGKTVSVDSLKVEPLEQFMKDSPASKGLEATEPMKIPEEMASASESKD